MNVAHGVLLRIQPHIAVNQVFVGSARLEREMPAAPAFASVGADQREQIIIGNDVGGVFVRQFRFRGQDLFENVFADE